MIGTSVTKKLNTPLTTENVLKVNNKKDFLIFSIDNLFTAWDEVSKTTFSKISFSSYQKKQYNEIISLWRHCSIFIADIADNFLLTTFLYLAHVYITTKIWTTIKRKYFYVKDILKTANLNHQKKGRPKSTIKVSRIKYKFERFYR